MYTFTTEYDHECKKAKDINKAVVVDELKHEDYKNVLFTRSCMRPEMNIIRSKGHNTGTYRIKKEKFILLR